MGSTPGRSGKVPAANEVEKKDEKKDCWGYTEVGCKNGIITKVFVRTENSVLQGENYEATACRKKILANSTTLPGTLLFETMSPH